MKVYNGENLILGRLGAIIAKDLLLGEQVILVNAEKLVISGKSHVSIGKYKNKRSAKNKANPENSPHWPRRPDFLVKRIIRGMLPYGKAKGRRAFKNLRVYIGIPQEFVNIETAKVDYITKERLQCKYITVSDLCTGLGYSFR